MSDFIPYPKIKRFDSLECTITQKIDGSNGQILIDDQGNIHCGSRNRWLTLEHDNYGFAQWVHSHKNALLDILGPGHYYGEWCGPGIQNGEGLSERTFVLFSWWLSVIPSCCRIVPILYWGPFTTTCVDDTFNRLMETGSHLVPGHQPEGIVITLGGHNYKKVFQREAQLPKERPQTSEDYTHLLDNVRLQKILAREEDYIREYPKSLRALATAYINDLLEEGCPAIDVKTFNKQLYPFLRHQRSSYANITP